MNSLSFLLEIIKISAAGLIVFFVAWVFIKEYLEKNNAFQRLEIKRLNLKHTLPLRLQAYERAVLFLERINPSNMLVRLHVPNISARELHQIILSDIRAEYQHNISQQIYMSDNAWAVLKKIKEDTIGLFNNAVNALPENASSIDLSKSVLTHLASLESENPYDLALNMVKSDVQSLL